MTSRTTHRALRHTALVLALALALPVAHLDAQRKPITLRDSFMNRDLFGARAGAITWMADGLHYSTLKKAESGTGQDLYRVDAATGSDERIVEFSKLTLPGSDTPLSFQSYQWSDDGRWLLLTLATKEIWRHSTTGDYLLYDTQKKELVALPKHASGIRNVKVSPDGAWVGYVLEDDIWIYNLASKQEVRLTDDAAPNLYNGRFGWVYEEEFSIVDGWRWSPDSKRIAFWQEDERNVPVYNMTNFDPLHLELIEIRYPKPGDPNPVEKIGVIEIATRERTWMDLGTDTDVYIPRIAWTQDPATLAIFRLNRLQNHLELLFADARTGRTRVVVDEKSATGWIDIENDDAIRFLPDGKRFLLQSERDGWKHVYAYDYAGRQLAQVTKGAWEVTDIDGVTPDGQWLYYVSTEASPLERHLYRVRMDGTKKERLTKEAGYHSISMSRSCARYTDGFSSLAQPSMTRMHDGTGKELRVLAKTDPAAFEKYQWSAREIMSFRTDDGTELYYSMIKPPDFDPTKSYPVILDVYGGPGYQNVVNRWPGASHQWMANEGFIVVQIDNRGGGARGTAFKHSVYKKLGVNEAADYAAMARHLATLPYVNGKKIGIWGWSYGGYMAALSMLLHNETFAAGVAIAPVTDWKLYDTIYAERYMQRPSDNPDGYRAGSCIEHADKLKGRLVLIHGGMDDNVHLQNTFHLIHRFNEAGRQYDMRVYPYGNHGVVGSFTSRLAMYEYWMSFFKQHLMN